MIVGSRIMLGETRSQNHLKPDTKIVNENTAAVAQIENEADAISTDAIIEQM